MMPRYFKNYINNIDAFYRIAIVDCLPFVCTCENVKTHALQARLQK